MAPPTVSGIVRGGIMLVLFSVIGAGVVALTLELASERIVENRQQFMLDGLNSVLANIEYDNDLIADAIDIVAPQAMGTHDTVQAYRVRHAGQTVAIVLSPVAPDGYNGSIKLVVGIDHAGRVTGVRVVAHQETPGLGDAIEYRRSDWIDGFINRSLSDPVSADWKVKRDGGVFDQFTGATITPRAVVGAVRRSLEYFQLQRDFLLGAAND